jgi:hypothetical protein
MAQYYDDLPKEKSYRALARKFPGMMKIIGMDQLTFHLNNQIDRRLAWRILEEEGFTVTEVESSCQIEGKYPLRVIKK